MCILCIKYHDPLSSLTAVHWHHSTALYSTAQHNREQEGTREFYTLHIPIYISKIFTFYMCRSGFNFDFQSNEANRDMHCFNWFAFTPKKRDRFTQNYLFIDKNVLMSNAITIKNSNKINRTKAFTCYRLYREKKLPFEALW